MAWQDKSGAESSVTHCIVAAKNRARAGGWASNRNGRTNSQAATAVRSDAISTAVLDALDDAVLLLDTDNKITRHNAAAAELVNASEGALMLDLFGSDGEQRRLIARLLDKARRGPTHTEVTVARSPKHEPVEFTLTLKPLPSTGQRVAILRDVSREKRNERALRELATRDELTRCYNRRYFISALEAEIERQRRYGKPVTLLLIDIDHFKRVNDTYGHAVGDAALAALAAVGASIFRDSDVFARLGGEEFGVLLPETNVEHGEIIAERFRKQLRDSVIPDAPADLFLTVSIGVTPVRSIMTPTTALKAADKALYRAKNTGRNRVVTCHAA